MNDVWSQYEADLNRLLTQLGREHPRFTEALVLQQRLLENVGRARLHGDTEISRAERGQILDALDRLALETLGDSSGTISSTGFGWFIRDAGGTITFAAPEPHIISSGDSSARLESLQRRLQSARKANDRAAEAALLDELGPVYITQGDFYQAIQHHKQAVAIARELGDSQSEAIYLQSLGLAFMVLADDEPDRRHSYLSRAADALRQTVELFSVLAVAPLLRARARYHLGRCNHRLGRWREAITSLEQAREAFSRHKARPELAHTLLELGQLHHLTHDFESAYIYLKDALRLFRRLKDTDGIAVTQEALGSLALQTARLSEAITSLQEARRGYAALRRDERVRAVDGLLRIAQQAHQSAGNRGVTL